MPSNILAVEKTAASSDPLVVVAGTPVTVGLKGVKDTFAKVYIQLKDDAGDFNTVGILDNSTMAVCITAPGTYQFTRTQGSKCGVYLA